MTLSEAFMAWRIERVRVDQIESRPILGHDSPFSADFDEWQRLKRVIEPGDELWTFRSPDEEWDRNMGWQGLVLVRGGQLIEFAVTAQN